MYFLHLLQISAAFSGPKQAGAFALLRKKMSPREFISLSPLEDAPLSGGWPFKTAHIRSNEPTGTIQVVPRLFPHLEEYVERQNGMNQLQLLAWWGLKMSG